MKRWAEMVALSAAIGIPGFATSPPNPAGSTAQMVITVEPAHSGGSVPQGLQAGEVTLMEDKANVPVLHLDRLSGSLANMQLFILLDDSTRSSSLGTHLPELKSFIQSLPATTQVAIGYMRNGTFDLAQPFTADHQKAAKAFRLPTAIPGENGSPYFGLSDLAKHWPSKEATGRRAVLALTDGVDRYYDNWEMDDPYVDGAIQDSLANGVAVYSIYLRGAGFYGRGGWATNMAQSRLMQVSEETGGYAYFEDLSDPVAIEPFLKDFRTRLDNQYEITFQPLAKHGLQPVKLHTEMPGIKVEGPTRIYTR
jgi:hypothetical protein